MPALRLNTKRVEKPWGRRDLWPGFADVPAGGDPVGEIWFEAPGETAGDQHPLLIKYLFTSEKLSVQVHPDDSYARAHGYPRGKDEAWVILAADPTAAIALGTREVLTREELRAAALDGSIEQDLDWKAVHAGDFFYSPAGTIHAIGPGLTLVEIQQNVDLTYRLYDYGRPRELHLDAGVAVANPVPYVAPHIPREAGPGRTILAEGPAFVIERRTRGADGRIAAGAERPVWLVPLKGGGTIGEARFEAGGVWLLDEAAALALDDGADLLLAYPGADVMDAAAG